MKVDTTMSEPSLSTSTDLRYRYMRNRTNRGEEVWTLPAEAEPGEVDFGVRDAVSRL